jgi:hypothetical protein
MTLPPEVQTDSRRTVVDSVLLVGRSHLYLSSTTGYEEKEKVRSALCPPNALHPTTRPLYSLL